MKLEDAESDYVGRVEICFKGVWGSICDEIANKEVALVVCKTLRKPLYGEQSMRSICAPSAKYL